uniref:Uncharacterized protein n=1 Tax=Rhizophora mucronata TaxID=61149 RepID=A0A2P2IKV6_RHIMU
MGLWSLDFWWFVEKMVFSTGLL